MRSHDPASLGEHLPFVAEFWRSSNHAFLSRVMEAPFPSSRMLLPYPAPPHWRTYSQMFNTNVCQRFCEQVLSEQPPGSELADSIRVILVNQPGRFPKIDEIAAHLGMSLRTLNRRLASEELSYQSIIDDVRRTLAGVPRAHFAVGRRCLRARWLFGSVQLSQDVQEVDGEIAKRFPCRDCCDEGVTHW